MKVFGLNLERKKGSLCILAGICSLSLFVIFNSGEKINENRGGSYAVKIKHYGIDAEEMERSVTVPLEDALFAISGVMSVESSSENSLSSVFVRFKPGTQGRYEAIRDAAQRVYETLPSSVQRPEILSSGNSRIPVWSAAFFDSSGDVKENVLAAQTLEKIVKPRLESLEGAGEVIVSGVGLKEIFIVLDQEKFAALGIEPQAVSSFLGMNDSIFSGGNIVLNDREIIITVDGRYEKPNSQLRDKLSLDRALIPIGEGKFTELSEIALITEQERQPDILSRLNGRKTASIAIMGRHGADLRKLSSGIKKELSGLDLNLDFTVLSDLGAEEAAAFRSVINAALSGAIMVALISLLLNGKNRFSISGLFCALAIPFVCLVSAAVLSTGGFSVDRLLLSGIAAGVGTAVDAVILCSEKMRKCKNYNTAQATLSELAGPLIAGAATTVAALLPLSAVEDGGARIIAGAIAVVTITALVLSLTFLPPLLLWDINSQKINRHITTPRIVKNAQVRLVRSMCRFLAANVRFCIRYPVLILAAAFALTASAIFALFAKGVDTSGYSSEDSVYAQVEFDGGLLAEEADRLLASYGAQIAGGEGIKNVETGARTGSGSLLISFDPKLTQAQAVRDFAKQTPIHGGFVFFHENSSRDRYWEIKIYGDEDQKCRELAAELAYLCAGHPLIHEQVLNFKQGSKKLVLLPDRELFAEAGVVFSAAAARSRLGVYGPVAYKRIGNDGETDVRIRTGGGGDLANYAAQNAVMRQSREGTMGLLVSGALRVDSLVTTREETEPSNIRRDNRRRTASITVATGPMDPRRVKQELNDLFTKLDLPPGYSVEFDPEAIKQAQALSATVLSLVMAVIFCYMIIASINESFTVPLIVLSAIPPSLSIPALCLFLSGSAYNSAIACAFIAVSGMTVNAAVLCVDGVNSTIRNGREKNSLSVYLALRKKMPALLSTTGTTVAGVIPFLFLTEGANALIRTLSLTGALGVACSCICSITVIPSLLTFSQKNNSACAGLNLYFRSKKMITKMFNKTIAVFLTAIFIFGLFPAAVFAQPNPPSSLGEIKGFNRSIFDSHFSRADREISPERWLAEAKLGVSQALYAWELTASRLYEDPQAFEEEKGKVEKWSDEELEKRFSQWLIGRFFGEAAEKALMNLSSSLGEIQKNYSLRLDEEGNVVFDDKTGDPLIIRPDEEGRESPSDFLLWRSDADEIVRKSGASFDTVLLNLYPELLKYIPDEMRETILAIIGETGASVSASVKREFENIAAREERIFTTRRTRDIRSLRKKSEDGSAKMFTEKLVAETEEACRQGIEELTIRIEQAEAGVGDLALMGEEWLRLYREQFEKGLKAWEDAEERFFMRRIEWEQESLRLFSEGEETWLAAFNQFEEERQKWELKAKELFQSGEAMFKNLSEDFQRTIDEAKKEFEINMEMRIGAGTTKVKALVDMYLVCASAAVSTKDNIIFWMNDYGISSDKNPADPDFTEWLSNEINQTILSLEINSSDYNKYEKLSDIQKAHDLYTSYLDKALDARDRILTDYAELIGTGVLKDILSPNASTDDFSLDEYQIALVRAKALVLYWERKTAITEAVIGYAEKLSSGKMTEAEGIRAWEEAKSAYNKSLAAYESELRKLNELGEEIQNQQEILNGLSREMQLIEEKLNRLNLDYSTLINISAVNRADYYFNTLNEKYNFLVLDYKLFLKTGSDAFYKTALEYGLSWGLSKQSEDAKAALNKLINGDNKTISLTELEDRISQGLISETELRIRLAGIDLFYDLENETLRSSDSDYSGADWYAAAKGLNLSDAGKAALYGDNLTARLVADYKNASRLLLEKRLEFEIEALINFLNEDFDSDDFEYSTSEFCLLDEDTATEVLEILSNLKKRMEQGLNVYTENDEENELIISFISGVSFFECSRELLAEYFDEYSFCTGLLDLYSEYAAVSSFGQKEAWGVTCNSLTSLFADYGIVLSGNFLPDAASLFDAISTKDGDSVQNTAQFLKDFDNCFTITPQWLEFEKENWKYAFMQLAAAKIYHSGIQSEKTSSDIYFEQEELYSENEELYLRAYSANFMEDDEMEMLNDIFMEINGKLLLLDYMGQIIMFLDILRYEETAAGGEKHWRNYLNGKNLLNSDPAITIVSAWKEGVLADAIFSASYFTNRINDSFTLFSQRDNAEAERNSTLNKNLYLEEASRISRKFNSLEYQYSEIAYVSKACEFTQLDTNEISDQLEVIINKISLQEEEYNAIRDEFFIAAEIFMTSGLLYDEQYNILKTAQENIDQCRFEYEKQDTAKRWASTVYLDKKTIDIEYYKTQLARAQTVLSVLSDIYGNENNRTCDDPQYNALYSEYKQSFGKKLLLLETLDSVLISSSDEINRSKSIFASYKDSLNRLGNVDKDYANYTLPAEMTAWTVKDFITVNDGRLAFFKDTSMKLYGVDASTAGSLNEFFKSDESHLSNFEESLFALSRRMSEYFSDNEKLMKWGLARDYLIYTLMNANKDITYLKSKYIGPGAMTNSGELGKLQVKPGVDLFDYTRDLYKLLTDDEWVNPFSTLFFTPNPKIENSREIYRMAWEELSAEEKADLEYYIILTLSDRGYSDGFSKIYTLSVYELAYNYVNDRYQYAKKERAKPINFLLFLGYDNMIKINGNALSRINSAYDETKKKVNEWTNEINQRLSSIQYYAALYNESSEKLATLKSEKESGQCIVWDDIESSLNYTLKKEKVDGIRILWEEMQETYTGNFSTISDALGGLLRWAINTENNSRENLETFWQYSAQDRLNNEYIYHAAAEAYLAGTGNADDLRAAAENAFGINTAGWKNHLANMHTALMNDLSLYLNADKDFYGEFSVLGNEIVVLTEKALTNLYCAEFAAREIEWNIMLRDIQEKYVEWQNTAALIFENGRADWNAGYQKMQDAYRQWTVHFQDEYNRVNEEWTMAYLAGIDDKESWLEQAAAAADRASAESFLSLMGTEGERLSRFVDIREPFGIRDAAPQAQNLVTELLQSSGIANMVSAFGSLNNISSTASTIVKRGLGGVSSWDAALVKTAATNLVRTTNAEIAAAEAKKLAYTARSNANEIINSLSANVQDANQNFRENMDNTFIMNGLWSRNGNNYVKDIIKGSTLFTPVISETVTITGYADYIMEPVSIQTNLDENFLSTLDYYTIQALIQNVFDEVNAYRDEIFGDKTAEPIDKVKQGNSEEKRTQSPGKFGEYIGYDPDTKSDFKDLTRESIFYDEGAGELGRLLADFIYWDMIDRKGKAEQALPAWDKRMWDDTDSFFTAPTIRSVGQIAGTIVSGVVSAALTAGTSGIAAAAIPFITAGINTLNELIFGTLDASLGYKTWEEAGFEMGKSLLINTTSSLIGAGTNVLSSAINTSSSFGSAVLQGATSAFGSYTTSVASSYINAYDFNTGKMDWETANSSWYSANTIASMASAGVSSGLGSYLSNPNVLSNSQQKFFGGAIDLATAGGAELTKYGVYTAYNLGSGMNPGDSFKKAYDDMGGLTINILNMGSMFDIIAGGIARNNNDGQLSKSASGIKLTGNLKNAFSKIGLLEVNFGSGGITSRIGTGGIDVGGALYDLAKRGIDYSKMQNMEDKRKLNIAMNTYINGDWTAENTSMRIASGLDDFQLYSEYDKIGYTILKSNGKGRVISMLDNGNDEINAIYLQHEAYRNGIVTDDNKMETNLATWAHTEMARKMNLSWEELSQNKNLVNDMIAYNQGAAFFNAYVDGNYDSSADYWRLTREGNLEYDGFATLRDADGEIIRAYTEMGLSSIYDVEGALLWLLNIDRNNYAGVEAVRELMENSGLTHDVDGYWSGNRLHYNTVNDVSSGPRYTNNTEANMGKTISKEAFSSLYYSMPENKAKESINRIYGSARGFTNYVNNREDFLFTQTILSRLFTSDEIANSQSTYGSNYVYYPDRDSLGFFNTLITPTLFDDYLPKKRLDPDGNPVLNSKGEEIIDTFCNQFVYDTISTYFGREIYNNMFPGRRTNANSIFLSFINNPYMERLDINEWGTEGIKQLADDGTLIIASSYNYSGSGHIAFLGNRNLITSSIPETPLHMGTNGFNLPAHHFLFVQAGTFNGTISNQFATNGYEDPLIRRKFLNDGLYFYRVRINP